MATASAVIDTKQTHNWRVEPTPLGNGRFQIVGYPKETNLGTQAPQAQQGQAPGAAATQAAGVAQGRVVVDSTSGLWTPQRPLPESDLAGLSENAGAESVRTQAQQSLNRWAQASGEAAPTLAKPDADAEAGVNVLGNLLGEATGLGQRVVAYSSPVTGESGFSIGGIAFVNTAPGVQVSAPRTALHEIKHVAERLAAIDTKQGRTNTPAQQFVAQIDSIFDDMTDEGKRSYIENFLNKEELDAIADPAAREARLMELVSSDKTRSEMTADFLGNRAIDRGFLIDLAKADPQGFKGFVQKWLSVIDNLVGKLRGLPTQSKKESARVDLYVRDLNKAKMVARDALIAFRKGNLDLLQQEGQEQGQEPRFSIKSTEGTAARERTPLGFYSALGEGVRNLSASAAPARGWKDAIKGMVNKGQAKADEVEWSGVNDWLDLQQGRVTKEQVDEYLQQGGVQVEETVLGGVDQMSHSIVFNEDEDGWDIVDNRTGEAIWQGDSQQEAEEALSSGDVRGGSGPSSKYGKYTFPGGENYREVLLTLPPKKRVEQTKRTQYQLFEDGEMVSAGDERAAARWRERNPNADVRTAQVLDQRTRLEEERAGQYRSSHWDQPNVLAHIRINDRTDADGNKVLFVEEIQSDWGQEGKKKGFKQDVDRVAIEDRMQAITARLREIAKNPVGETEELAAEWNRLSDEKSQLTDQLVRSNAGVPSAPFVAAQKFAVFKDGKEVTRTDKDGKEVKQRYDSMEAADAAAKKVGGEARDLGLQANTEGWLNLALKRVMVMAAEGGYDRVAFVNGEQSAERYDLSKQISKIRYEDNRSGGVGMASMDGPPTDGQFYAYDLDGDVKIDKRLNDPVKELPDLIGKELAERLLNAPPVESRGIGSRERRREVSGLDLKVGGEGMKTFYDTIVPTALKKLLPKVGGGQMTEVQIEREAKGLSWPSAPKKHQPQPGFDVTDAMREKVAEGVPLFSKKPEAEKEEGKPRVGKVDTHVLGAERGERVESSVGRLTEEEKAIIAKGAKRSKDATAAELAARVRDNKRAHPASDNWASLTLIKVKVNESGKAELIYKTVPYDFNVNAKGKALKTGSKDYSQRVQSMSGLMLDEVRAVYERALQGDKAAINIIAQSGWYKEMRTRLRQEFGGLGDLFADLLGATSPNTPVRTNWDNSIEALRLATQGKFDELLPKWINYFDRLEQAETKLRGFFDQMLKEGMSKKAIKQLDEYKRLSAEARQARNFPDSLLPVKSNGKKFGFNGYNVARAMVDLWRVVRDADADIGRGATAPKAINFSGNLIGFRSKATIDVWAARMLQRLAGKLGMSGMGLRIPSMAEGGVSGAALRTGENTLQFGFGQDVFSSAVRLIRNDPQLREDPVLAGINDDDLQALVWFIEKEIWTKNNWTSAAGEGGSFEFEADLAGVADRDRVNELRREADSSIASTAEQREQAQRDIESTTQKMQNYPGVVEAQATLDRNAELVKKGGLSKDQKEQIKAENAQARERMSKAKKTKGYGQLRKELDRAKNVLKKPTKEERREMRAQAVGELGKMARTVDRFTLGLSIQKGAEQGMAPTPPSDADMAGLARRIVTAVTSGSNADTVIAVKAIATEGRYGTPERALDAEFIVNEKFDPAPLAAAVFREAKVADQDAAFVARALRPDEKFDPLLHRPGIEIYFRDMNQAQEAARIMAGTLATRVSKPTELGPGFFSVGGYTVIVDGRPTAEAKAGAMGKPVGMRVIYMPEFEARYGDDPRLKTASEDNIRDIVKERADNLGNFADEILRKFDGVSFAGRFDYEVDTRFAGEYQGAIDGYTSAAPAGGADQGRGKAWQGRSVGESVAAAVGRLPLDAGQQGAAVLDRGDTDVRFSRRPGDDARGREAGGRAADRALQASERAASEEALTPLPGAPKVPGYHGPDPRIVSAAERYARDNGIPLRRQAEYVAVDTVRAKRIANAYEVMRHAPNDPKVKEAYENLVRQTRAQYDALVQAGYKFWFMDMDRPDNKQYATSPWNQMRDLRETQSMGVFPTESGFGTGETAPQDNVMLADTGLQWPSGSVDGPLKRVLANDLFRAVHDAFGHGMEGSGFREQGEENAWQAHVRLYTGSAVGAITSETRGQNSWLNYGPYGEKNRTAKVEDTVFAEQKTGLMPEWTWTEGRADDAPAFSRRVKTDTPEFKRWFGDSKVVDEQGRPLVVYHGTSRRFFAFDEANSGKNFSVSEPGAFYFVDDKDYARKYADAVSKFKTPGKPRVVEAYLSIKNPTNVDSGGEDPNNYIDANRELIRNARSEGSDGVIVRSSSGLTTYIAFRPEQIKSAIGNSGAFDPANPDIRFSRAQPVNTQVPDQDVFEEFGRFAENRIDADRAWADGDHVFAVAEMDEEPTPVTSPQMLAAYTPDQLMIIRARDWSPSEPAAPDQAEVASLFRDLQDARGLGRVRALERVDAHPMAETIRRIDEEFMDILERLDDAGLVKINC